MKLVILIIQTIFYFCSMKKLPTVKLSWMVILLSSYFHANSQCQTGDCENGYGVYTMSWGDKYHGGWKDGVMERWEGRRMEG